MPRFSQFALPQLALIGLTLIWAGGCATKPAPQSLGLIPPGERGADLRDDNIRVLGVDRAPPVPFNQPFYDIPGSAFSAGFDYLIVTPTVRLYEYFTNDTPANAARDMLDQQSADKRRHGILRLAEESYARQGTAERDEWASMAGRDRDYTVKAAAIRALNWSRDPNHTQVFIDALTDPQPLVRLEAAKALANVPDPKAASPLEDRLDRDVSRDVRIASADALRFYNNDEVIHALINVLDDSSFDVAWQARQSLRLMTAHDFGYDSRAWLGYLTK
jgi:hypothetical protein